MLVGKVLAHFQRLVCMHEMLGWYRVDEDATRMQTRGCINPLVNFLTQSHN